MARLHVTHWRSLEHWSPTLFLAAGVLFVGHAAVRGVEAFTAMPPPVDVFGPAGYAAAVLGLLGLHRTLAGRTPTTARAAAFAAAFTAPGWVLIAGLSFGEAAGVLPPQTAILPGAFFVAVIVATLLTYLVFGVASLRAGVHTRATGLLVLAPAVLLVLLIAGSAVLSVGPATGGVIIGGGQAIAHGAIGGTLLTGRTRTARMDPSGESTPD